MVQSLSRSDLRAEAQLRLLSSKRPCKGSYSGSLQDIPIKRLPFWVAIFVWGISFLMGVGVILGLDILFNI